MTGIPGREEAQWPYRLEHQEKKRIESFSKRVDSSTAMKGLKAPDSLRQ